jgi:hypothetical protein
VRARSVIRAAVPVLAGAVVVTIAVGGVRSAGAVDLEFRSLIRVPGQLETVLVAVAVLGVPLILLSMLLRRVRADDEDGKRRWVRRLVLLAAVVLLVVVIQRLLPRPDDDDTSGDADPFDLGGGIDVGGWSAWAAALAAGLVLAAGAALVWRAQASRAEPVAPTTTEPDREVAALRAAGAALDEQPTDPRAAVVACYAAMEDVLASAGTARRRAETPEELLARAVSDGRLPAEPGRLLTELFLIARFSSAPITDADVTACRDALLAIDAEVVW